MKILMTTDTIGGVWQYALELARGLLPYGAEVALATLGAPLTADQRRDAAALPNVEVFESRYKLIWMEDPWWDVAASGTWLLELCRRVRPQLVHLNDYPHGGLPWPVPVVLVGHSCVLSWWQAVHGTPAPPEWHRYRDAVARGLRAADRVVAPSAAMLGELERLYGPLPRTRVIYNGRRIPAHPDAPKEPFILAAGRVWDEAKNLAALARVAAHLPWPVCIAGEIRHPDRGMPVFDPVQLLGRLPSETLETWFARAAVYALPARYEPFGLSILEAALSGCALVLGDIPSLREVWGDAALFVDPDDSKGLGATLTELAQETGLRCEYAHRAKERASVYTAERMAAEYWSLYSDLTAERGSSDHEGRGSEPPAKANGRIG